MSDCCSSGTERGPLSSGIVLDSVIQCPHCGTSKTERMPVDACQIAYECTGCGSSRGRMDALRSALSNGLGPPPSA